jgi:ketosteroid isomerase-like protein
MSPHSLASGRLARLAAAALALTACTRPVDLESEREALLRTDGEWASVVGSGDVDKIVSYWSDDAILLPPDGPAVVGKQAIRSFVAEAFEVPGFSITWQSNHAVVSADGSLGYTVGTNSITTTGADRRPVTTRGKGVAVWRKEPNGAWRCVVDIWNADAPQGRVGEVVPEGDGDPK